MSASIYIGLGVLGVGGLYLLARASRPDPDECDKLVDPEAIRLCKAGRAIAEEATNAAGNVVRGILDVLPGPLGGRDENTVVADNVRLNGPGADYLDDQAMAASGIGGCLWPDRTTPRGGVILRHANGCEPFEGAPGWSKCAPGTKHAARKENCERGGKYGRDVLARPDRDPLTFRWDQRPVKADKVPIRGQRVPQKFPLAVPSGSTAWMYRGRPLVCPAGTDVNPRVQDHTGGPPCTAPRPAPVVPPRPQGGTRRPPLYIPNPFTSGQRR